jgi:hypothetical protein
MKLQFSAFSEITHQYLRFIILFNIIELLPGPTYALYTVYSGVDLAYNPIEKLTRHRKSR